MQKMNIRIQGYRTSNLALYKDLRKAARFYGESLLGKRMSANISLNIKLTKYVKKNPDELGSCIPTDDSPYRQRKFQIELDLDRSEESHVLAVLAHEMVHVKQYVRNELLDLETLDLDSLRTRWKSRTYIDDNTTYDDQPWEKEAFRLQDKLHQQFEESYYGKAKKKRKSRAKSKTVTGELYGLLASCFRKLF